MDSLMLRLAHDQVALCQVESALDAAGWMFGMLVLVVAMLVVYAREIRRG